jgi:ANTH domain
MSKWYKLLGGEQQKRLWVLKTTSAAPGGPKPKYLRKLVAALWEGGLTLGGFFQLLRYRPLADNPIVAVKALITLMRVLQQGPPHCLMEITPYADVVDEIGQMWARSESCGSNSGSSSGSSGAGGGGTAAGSSGLDEPAMSGAGVAPQDAAFATLICRLAAAIVQKVSLLHSIYWLALCTQLIRMCISLCALNEEWPWTALHACRVLYAHARFASFSFSLKS